MLNATVLRLAALTVPVGLIVAAAPVQAETLTATQIFQQFNVVAFNNFSETSDVGGRTVVGGSVTSGSATYYISGTTQSASDFAALNIYGNSTSSGTYTINNGGSVAIAGANSTSITLNNGGSVNIGGNNSGTLNTTGAVTVGAVNSGTISAGGSVYLGSNTGNVTANNGASISINGNNSGNLTVGGGTLSLKGNNTGAVMMNGGTYNYTGSEGGVTLNGGAKANKVASLSMTAPTSTLASSPFVSTFETPLLNLSTQLSGMTANSTTSVANNQLTFTAKPNTSGTAVFNISSATLTSAASVAIALDGATTVIINVDVAGCTTNCSINLSGVNFLNDTSYASQVLWNFVNASSIAFNNEFGGSILAPDATITTTSAIDGTVVANNISAEGEIHSYAFTGTLPAPDSVPEPTSIALLVSAFGGLAIARRKRGQRRG